MSARDDYPDLPGSLAAHRQFDEMCDEIDRLRAAALHACDTPDCPAITYRCAESRTP